MIEKRFIQWYAADAGVDLDIAEREVVLTYVMKIFSDRGLLSNLTFKARSLLSLHRPTNFNTIYP
jgi:hypothetical protein